MRHSKKQKKKAQRRLTEYNTSKVADKPGYKRPGSNKG